MKRRLFYLDLLRVVGILAVIFVHVAVQNWEGVAADTPELVPLAFWEGINRFAVPLFVMISGAIFLNPERKVTASRLWRHNILKMVAIFFSWAAIYAVASLAFGKGWPEALSDLLFGHYHMWFLILIIGLYIITPLVRKITEDEKVLRYFLKIAIPVAFVLSWLVPLVASWLTQATGLAEMELLVTRYNDLHLEVLGGYMTYFVLGYYLSKRVMRPQRRRLLYLAGILAALTQVMGTLVISHNLGAVSLAMRNDFLPTVLLMTAAVFVAGKQIGERVARTADVAATARVTKRFERVVSQMASCVLGIYLVHIIILAIVNKIGLSDVAFNSWLAVPVTTIAVFLISWVVISMLNLVLKAVVAVRKDDAEIVADETSKDGAEIVTGEARSKRDKIKKE